MAAPKDIKWGTGPVGSSGHKALVVLADLLNKEMPDDSASACCPIPGAVGTVKGFATGEFDGYYGSDVALERIRHRHRALQGLQVARSRSQPVQSLWCYTLDVGVAIKATDATRSRPGATSTGKEVYTGPLPFDTRKQLENALKALGVKHIYKAVDLETAGSQLNSGRIKAHDHLCRRRQDPAAVAFGSSLAVDWAASIRAPTKWPSSRPRSSPSRRSVRRTSTRRNLRARRSTLVPFYWGFDLGMSVSEDEMYKMLKVIEKHADELAKLDPSFRQIGGGKMAEFQKAALEVDRRPGADPSRPRQVPEGKEDVGHRLGFPRRQGEDVSA